MSEPLRTTMVVKVGTSSITDAEGVIDSALVAKLCGEIAGS
jgi:glutamate 5-kinase